MNSEHGSKSSIEDLPIEIMLEIFDYIDIGDLLRLSVVCKRWNGIVFRYKSHRIRRTLGEKGTFIMKGIGMAPDRIYKNLHIKSPMLDTYHEVMKIFYKLAPNVETLTLQLDEIHFKDLLQLIKWCPRLKELYITGLHETVDSFFIRKYESPVIIVSGLCSTSLEEENPLNIIKQNRNSCILTFDRYDTNNLPITGIKSLGLDISDPHTMEKYIAPLFLDLTELEITVRDAEVYLLRKLAPQLKVLKAKVGPDGADKFYALRLPELDVLVLRPVTFEYNKKNDLKQFLLGCKALTTAMFLFSREHDVFPTLAEGLPFVQKLEIASAMTTALGGLEKMKHLKKLSLVGCCLIGPYYSLPHLKISLKTLECIGAKSVRNMGKVLHSFSQLEQLTLTLNFTDDMVEIFTPLTNVRELLIYIDQVPEAMVHQLRNLTNLKTLFIKTVFCAKKNLLLMKHVITLPSIRRLEVNGRKLKTSPEVSGKIAAANRYCSFIVNGVVAEPEEEKKRVRPVADKKPSKRQKSSTA